MLLTNKNTLFSHKHLLTTFKYNIILWDTLRDNKLWLTYKYLKQDEHCGQFIDGQVSILMWFRDFDHYVHFLHPPSPTPALPQPCLSPPAFLLWLAFWRGWHDRCDGCCWDSFIVSLHLQHVRLLVRIQNASSRPAAVRVWPNLFVQTRLKPGIDLDWLKKCRLTICFLELINAALKSLCSQDTCTVVLSK